MAEISTTSSVAAIEEGPKIQNVISTASLGCSVKLSMLAGRMKHVEYKPNHFQAVVARIRNPATTCQIFRNGKMLCMGAKTEADSKVAIRKFARLVQKLGYPVHFQNFQIHNIVASYTCSFRINLDELCNHLAAAHKIYKYDPTDSFPALSYDMESPKLNILIFYTGKLILTGTKSKDNLKTAFDQIYPLLRMCEKPIRKVESSC